MVDSYVILSIRATDFWKYIQQYQDTNNIERWHDFISWVATGTFCSTHIDCDVYVVAAWSYHEDYEPYYDFLEEMVRSSEPVESDMSLVTPECLIGWQNPISNVSHMLADNGHREMFDWFEKRRKEYDEITFLEESMLDKPVPYHGCLITLAHSPMDLYDASSTPGWGVQATMEAIDTFQRTSTTYHENNMFTLVWDERSWNQTAKQRTITLSELKKSDPGLKFHCIIYRATDRYLQNSVAVLGNTGLIPEHFREPDAVWPQLELLKDIDRYLNSLTIQETEC